MNFIIIFMIGLLMLSCENSSETKKTERPRNAVSKDLKLFDGGEFNQVIPEIEGFDGDKRLWLSQSSTLFSVSLMDFYGDDEYNNDHYGNFGDLTFSNNEMIRESYLVYHDFQMNFNDVLDLPNYDENTPMTLEIKNSNDYFDTNYQFNSSLNELYDDQLIITNWDIIDDYNFQDDYSIVLNQVIDKNTTHIYFDFVMYVDEEFTLFDQVQTEISRRIYLQPIENKDNYLLSAEAVIDLVKIAVTKFENYLLYKTGIRYDFSKVKVNHIQFGITYTDINYGSFDVQRKRDNSMVKIPIYISKTDHKFIKTNNFEISMD